MGVKVRERPEGSGNWWIFVHHKGKRTSRKIGSKAAAQKVAKQLEAELVLNGFGLIEKTKATPLFKDYAIVWLETAIKGLRRDSTYNRYKGILEKHVFPVLGNTPINEVNRASTRNLLLNLHQKGYSKSTICLVRDVLSGCFGHAADDELIASNPVSGVVKRLKLERGRRLDVEPFSPEEVNLFLEACREHYPEHYPFFLCAFRTGMRLGEILALEWGDVDWNKKFIHVGRSYRRGRVESTKNGKSRRVDMSDQLTATLKQLSAQRKREALQEGEGALVEIIFHDRGRHMEQNYVRRVFERVLKKAGIRKMRLHDIRHTFASILLTNGESPVYVKEQLGHSSIQITVDIYGHLIPSANRSAVNRLDDMHSTATYAQPTKGKGCNPLGSQPF